MSTTDGDAASRLDDALADVLDRAARGTPDGTVVPPATTDADWNVDGPDDDVDGDVDGGVDGGGPYRLPDIVPATPVTATVEARAPTPATPPPTATAPTAAATPAAAATSWADHMVPLQAGPAAAGLRTPGRRPRVRRVTRVVRHVDPWSTFKLGLLFSVVAYLVTLTAGVLLWRVADSTGTLDNVERWFTQFGWETFELDGGEIFHNAWIIGLFGAVAMTGGLVLLATLFNLVSDIVGGIRVTVLEEEVVERTVSSTRRYVVRRPPVGSESAPAWDVESGDDADLDEASDPDANDVRPATDWSIDDDPAADDESRSVADDVDADPSSPGPGARPLG